MLNSAVECSQVEHNRTDKQEWLCSNKTLFMDIEF